MEKFYKIRNTKSQLYSVGGTRVDEHRGWSRTGKVWTKLGTLRSHLTQHLDARTNMSDWAVVEYAVSEVSAKPISEALSAGQLVRLLKKT
jgi:hypothetical protein